MRLTAIFAAAALIGLVLLSGPAKALGPNETEAVKAAQAWLDLVDQEKYAASWQAAAGLFKGAVSRDQWPRTLAAVRKPLGKILSRKLIKADYRTQLPGAPDGHYVIIQLQSAFEHKRQAVETITPMRESDGAWRVSGYYIR